MGAHAMALLALLGGCGGGSQAPVALAAGAQALFDETVVRRIDIEVDVAAMDADLEQQLLTPWWERDLAYFEGTVRFEGQVWEREGVRYKGTGSFEFAHALGSRKLPLKLDFEEFVDGQTFLGLEKLSFANGYKDPRCRATCSRCSCCATWARAPRAAR